VIERKKTPPAYGESPLVKEVLCHPDFAVEVLKRLEKTESRTKEMRKDGGWKVFRKCRSSHPVTRTDSVVQVSLTPGQSKVASGH
jgi:hypothetical protein